MPEIAPTPSQETLDLALLAGRRSYQRLYQLNHDPRVAQMVDQAVEAAVLAATPAIFADGLNSAANDFGAGEWRGVFAEADVVDDVSAVQATTQWLRERAGK